MGMCTHHPDRETRFQCLKHGVWLCEACLTCRDPELYCKHRSACPIHYIQKRQKRREAAEVADGVPAAEVVPPETTPVEEMP